MSSPIDKRPKFHLYKPNIALISGISWDHINVFPTYEIYKKQFEIFVESIVEGGSVTYNLDDIDTKEIVNNTNRSIRKFDYSMPDFNIRNGVTYLQTIEGELPLEIFGRHNLSNLMGAKWICQQMGVDEDDFFQAISCFKGASNRLEKVYSKNNSFIFKDFAHSPSKVKATVNAIKDQFDEYKIIACFELHTFSSLNSDFINEYKDTLSNADIAIVYFSKKTLESKKMSNIEFSDIVKAFNNNDLIVFDDSSKFKDYLSSMDFNKSVLLMMSSGNFGNIDGDNPAAMRYTEARLQDYTNYFFDGIEENSVDFKDNYDGQNLEPVVLPSQLPNILINGAMGIAVGMATNIPPHNIVELIVNNLNTNNILIHCLKFGKL